MRLLASANGLLDFYRSASSSGMLSDGAARIVALARQYGQLTPRLLMDELDISKPTATRRLRELTDKGLLVVRVPPGGGLPLEEGDVLQTIDGRTPESPGHAFRILHSYQPGEKVKLGVLRQRKPLVLEATIPSPDAAERRMRQRTLQGPPPPPPAPAPRRAPAAPDDGPA